MEAVGSVPHDGIRNESPWALTEREGRFVEDMQLLEPDLGATAPSNAQDVEEIEATRTYKRMMLEDAARSTSFRKGGPCLSRAAQMRVLETDLSRAGAQRDLLRKMALSAEARQHSEEDRATELETKSQAAEAALATLEAWMDRQPLSRTAQAPDKQKELAKLATQAQVAREAASAQRAAATREHHVHLHAKREADRAERELHANAEVLETLAGEKAAQEVVEKSEVSQRISIEESVAGKMKKHHRTRASQRGEARQKLHQKAQAQLKAAKAARGAAAERSNLLVRDAAPALEEVIRMRDEAHAQRVECVLQLKADTEAAAALIRGANERRTAEQLREEAEHEAEKEELAAKGLNPYQVFKQRAVDARAVREENKQENRIRLRKEELAERLKKEEALRIKQDAKARFDKDQEQRMRDELGRHVVDARNREYLRGRTVDGTDVLDPSGRSFRVEPSQVTTIKDAAFGLGYHPRKTPAMAAAVVDLVASKPRHAGVGAGEFARLVPQDSAEPGGRDGTVDAHDQDGDHETKRPGAVDGPGRGMQQPQQAHQHEQRQQQQHQLLEDLVPPPAAHSFPGTGIPFVVGGAEIGETNEGREHGNEGEGTGKGGAGGKGGRHLSLFEVQALERARARQKGRMDAGEPQVAAGRTFKDRPAFVAKPDRVIFKDFVVGKVHRRRVVLTNASLTFNTLKVLSMSDEVRRFFEVTYAKPGRLSAGMTCAVDIAFTPKVEEDILTELPIRTQTGPLFIPIECTARRVKPNLSTSLVVFRGTIMGEKEAARVTVTNEGVVPTRFTVTTTTTTSTTSPKFSPSHKERPHTATIHGDDEFGMKQRNPRDGSPQTGESEPRRPSGPGSEHHDAIEADLLERASAVGDAGLKYPEGQGAIEVVDGGGELAGYGSTEIVVVFAPLTVGDFRTVKTIRFDGTDEEFQLVVEASSSPVAVFLAEACTDLRCCVFGKLYLKKIRICNRGKIAMKAVARVPASLRGCASFSPDMGFVQPGSFFEFGLRFRPDVASLVRCVQDGWGIISPPPPPPLSSEDKRIDATEQHLSLGREIMDGQQEQQNVRRTSGVRSKNDHEGNPGKAPSAGSGGTIVIPLKFDVPGQALPARSVLQARLTGWNVELSFGEGGGETGTDGGGSDGRTVLFFGDCFVGQSVRRRVALRNTSLLPAKFGFVGNAIEVDIQPADGFGVLLPGEERWVEATFSPVSSVSHDSTMSFRTSLGQTTAVRCRGSGIQPVISLSHTVLDLAPACLGDTVTASVLVNNVSATTQSLEFLSPEPELSFLKICPSVVHLRPREGARIEVSFCPPVSLPGNGSTAAAGFDGRETSEAENQEKEAESDAAAVAGVAAVGGGIGGGKDTKKKGQDKTKATTAAPQKGNSAAATTKSPAEEQPEQRQEGGGGEEGNIVPTAADATRGGDDGHVSPVPRYAGDVDESGDGVGEEHGEEDEEDFEGGQEPWSQHGRWRVPCFLKKPGMQSALGRGKGGEGRPLPPLALEVNTVTVERVLSVDRTRVDFGQLAVGTKAEAILRVKNSGDEDAPLEGGGLNSVGPFEVVNAFRAVPARGGNHRCVLQFRPERAGIVSETLVLTSPSLGKSIRVRLRGEGVRPVLRMVPANGRLDMGRVLEGDTVEREVSLRNDSIFPLRYTTSPFGPRPPSNVNHLETFCLVPCEGAVPPGESVTVKAVFTPDYSRIWPFLGAFRVEARDQPDGGHILRMRGSCLSRQLYVEAVPPGQNPCDSTSEATEDALAPQKSLNGEAEGGATGRAGLQSAAPAPPPIVLRFPKTPGADNGISAAAAKNDGGNNAGAKGLAPTPAAAMMKLIVGSLVTNDPKKSSPGTFEVELSAEAKEKGYFKVTPDKGAVAAGATAEVSCAFEPPPRPPRVPGPAGGKGGTLEVGQWYKTTALVHLRGGYRPPGSVEVLTVPVHLAGFVTA